MKKQFSISLIFLSLLVHAQVSNSSLDKVIAIVGKYMVLKSDVDMRLAEARSNGLATGANGDCIVLEQLLREKLLLEQADRDSVTVTDSEVENGLNRRMNFYIQQLGSEKKLVETYGKEISLLKEDFRKELKEILIAQKMESRIIGDLKVTPAEVRNFFNSIKPDSLPLINSRVEIGEIVKIPLISAEAKKEAYNRLSKMRKEILEQGNFEVFAELYGSKMLNAERQQLVPEFAAAAFRLKPGEVSEIVETMYGYHIIQLIERRGDFIDVRHILIQPKMTEKDLLLARHMLDSVYDLIQSGKINFCEAAEKFSDEKETKMNCGLMTNNAAGNTRFEIEELGQMDEKLVFMLDKMNPDEISKPLPFITSDQKQAYRLLYLKNRITPHKANLKDDYREIQEMALLQKKQKKLDEWISKKIKNTYIRIDEYYNFCKFANNWLQATN